MFQYRLDSIVLDSYLELNIIINLFLIGCPLQSSTCRHTSRSEDVASEAWMGLLQPFPERLRMRQPKRISFVLPCS
jgi:hypothetical protein